MRVLLTGATGFIGSRLASRCSDCGHAVSAIVRSTSDVSTIADVVSEKNCHVFNGTYGSVDFALRKSSPDVVVHLASLFIAQHNSDDVVDLVSSNVLFGAFVLEAMKVNGVHRLVNTSTNWEHFKDAPYNPANLYAATKKAFEDILLYYVEAHSLRAITLELTDTYGEADHRRKIINLLIQAIRTDTPIDVSPGEQLLDLVHVEDVIDAYMIACKLCMDEPTGHRSYSVSSGKPIKLKDIVALMERICRKPIAVNLGGRQYRFREVMKPWLNGEPLPGWKCRRTLEAFLTQQLADG